MLVAFVSGLCEFVFETCGSTISKQNHKGVLGEPGQNGGTSKMGTNHVSKPGNHENRSARYLHNGNQHPQMQLRSEYIFATRLQGEGNALRRTAQTTHVCNDSMGVDLAWLFGVVCAHCARCKGTLPYTGLLVLLIDRGSPDSQPAARSPQPAVVPLPFPLPSSSRGALVRSLSRMRCASLC